MKTVLVVYDSRYGHTARIARCIWETIINEGHQADSFFCVSVVARTPAKATPEGNVYCRKFLENNPWHPKDVKCFAGKVDYPNWGWLDTKLIQMIMKMTKGPTEPTAVIDYTNWDEVAEYARHCLTLEA